MKNIRVNDRFWSGVQSLIRDVVIPYQGEILEDKLPVAEKSRAVENFRIAAGESDGEHYGMVFQDSDLAKWLEAVAYSLAVTPDAALEKRADDLIALIGRAQEPDGYLNTYFTVKEPDKKWTNLRECHEMYCSGHMIEAAVAYYEATGKDSFLNIMRRNADLICGKFGYGKTRGFPGHQEIEIALLRLYGVTGDKKYLETAEYFINERGTEPDFFTEEGARLDWAIWNKEFKRDYNQAHKPVRQQDIAVGHSVRAVYMYTAMAALASETDDAGLASACGKLWENITQKQMYITGGIGSTVHGEAFTVDYDLPNGTAYAETCASVAMCFFARKMLALNPDGKYADVMERMLYNVVLASMQLDGKRFFYVNPLEVIPGLSGVVQTRKHVLPKRPEWYACACCPPNVARLLLSLDKYAWGEKDGTVYSHIYMGGTAAFETGGGVTAECESDYLNKGRVRYKFIKAGSCFTFAVHVPVWCREVKFRINGEDIDNAAVKNGYAYFCRNWMSGDSLEINFTLPVLRIYSNLAVGDNAGQIALQRGPMVYCFEEQDNGAELAALRLPRDSEIKTEEITEGELKGMLMLKAEGIREICGQDLYSETRPSEKNVTLTAVPYYAWGNRKPGEMRVWIRSDK